MKHMFLLFAFSVWEYWLGKTQKLIANSSLELVSCIVKWLFGRMKEKWKKIFNWAP